MIGPVGKSQKFQQFLGSGICLAHALSCNQHGYGDVLQCGEFRKQLMELEYESDMPVAEGRYLLLAHFGYILSVVDNLSAVGFVE